MLLNDNILAVFVPFLQFPSLTVLKPFALIAMCFEKDTFGTGKVS